MADLAREISVRKISSFFFLKFTWNFLRPFGFIVVEGDPRPMTQKSRPGQCSRNSERKAKGEHVTRECDREDFRLQTLDVSWTARALHAATARLARSRVRKSGVRCPNSSLRRGAGTVPGGFVFNAEAQRRGGVCERTRGDCPR